MRIEELDYDLPPGRIAPVPASPRDHARLMVIHRSDGRLEHRHVYELPDLLPTNGLMIFNHTRVLPAYLQATRAATGGKVTGLFLRVIADVRSNSTQKACSSNLWQVMLHARGTLCEGERLVLDEQAHLDLIRQLDDGQWQVQLHADTDTMSVLARVGRTPLPPYIRRARCAIDQKEITDEDSVHYNTVFALDPGSVAAPTAGLHFTTGLIKAIERAGIRRAELNLNIGSGTFAPIRTEHLDQHTMHPESFSVPAETLEAIATTRARGQSIIPIGTTSVRALESLPKRLPHGTTYNATTNLFITPRSAGSPHGSGYPFRFADALMTNFHLPRSTLLALVAALPGVGIDRLKTWYQIAIDHDYRFYSYGDAMLIL